MIISVSNKFRKQYRKLPKEIRELAKVKEMIFRQDAYDARLKTHKLSGKDKELWAFWINKSYRIKFVFLSAEKILFLEVGLHDIYR